MPKKIVSAMDMEKMLEGLAKILLDYLKTDIRYGDVLPRPFFIEFTGSPSSGKTTTITELDKFLRRQGFRVWRPQEGAEVIRHISRSTPVYNIRTLIYALAILLDQSYGHNYDVVIFDRCIFDAYVWMMYWEEKEELSLGEKEIFQAAFLSRFWKDKIDAAYFFVCDPDIAIEREHRVALSSKLGNTTSPKGITTLIERYRKAYADLSEDNPQLSLVDTSKMTEKEMIEGVATQTLNMLLKKIEKASG